MGVGEIAGLIAAIAFAVLAGFMIYPLIRLGKMFDQISQTVRESGEHAIPALDEGVTTVKQVNKSLEDVNKISAAASTTANNVGALTDLYGSFLGKPRRGSDVQTHLLGRRRRGHRNRCRHQGTGLCQGQYA